jgi:hypothetical protein
MSTVRQRRRAEGANRTRREMRSTRSTVHVRRYATQWDHKASHTSILLLISNAAYPKLGYSVWSILMLNVHLDETSRFDYAHGIK